MHGNAVRRIAARAGGFAGRAKRAAQLKTPVQIGENFYGPRDLADAIAARAGDVVMPDLMRIGGITGRPRAAAIAGAAGVPMSTHLYPESSAHMMRVTETAHWPDAPGAGIKWEKRR